MPSGGGAMDDGQPGKAQCSDANPLRRHVEQVGTKRQPNDEYDVANEVYPKRHHDHPD